MPIEVSEEDNERLVSRALITFLHFREFCLTVIYSPTSTSDSDPRLFAIFPTRKDRNIPVFWFRVNDTMKINHLSAVQYIL
jgi:hypothetical protein